MVVVGDPDDCAKAVQRWVDIGADQICFSPTTSNMGQDDIIRRWSCSAKRSSRSSTPIRCTAARACAKRRRPRPSAGCRCARPVLCEQLDIGRTPRRPPSTSPTSGRPSPTASPTARPSSAATSRAPTRELEERANRLADWMLDQGVGPGEHVGLYLTNGIEYLEAMLAALQDPGRPDQRELPLRGRRAALPVRRRRPGRACSCNAEFRGAPGRGRRPTLPGHPLEPHRR